MNKQLIVAMTSIAMIASSCVSTQKSPRNVANENAFQVIQAQGSPNGPGYLDSDRVKNLSDKDVSEMASASGIKLQGGQLLTTNDTAFQQKLNMINRAKSTIRMVYYIYADDDSSSKINQALIDAAVKRHVKVDLLVDFVTNYKDLDLFEMLDSESNHGITVHFYNAPPDKIIADANYMTLPCPQNPDHQSDACYRAKDEANVSQTEPTSYAKILLAGFYGKNATALKFAVGKGADINPEDYGGVKKGGRGQDAHAMIEFANLASDALIKNSLVAKLKLSIAMATYGDTLNPVVNEITGRLPLRHMNGTDKEGSGQLWDHITDYTHHKLIAIDGQEFQLGGRNIEDSYHMNRSVSGKGKYIFFDTDFWGKTAPGGVKGIEATYDNILKTPMVASLERVESTMSYDFVANTGAKGVVGASEMAIGYCMKPEMKIPDEGLADCALKALPNMPGFDSKAKRIADAKKEMGESIARYDAQYKQDLTPRFTNLSQNDLNTAKLFYLENLTYKKGNVRSRIIGSNTGYETDNSKNIQAIWYRGLENVCKVSKDEKRDMQVVFNTAYLLMPSAMVNKIAKMMNNDFGDCSRVHMTFITNSAATTDLGPINLLARYQLGAIFTHYKKLEAARAKTPGYKQFWPEISYYEFQNAAEGKGRSLHTKTSLLGDDLVVGSANADVRSYFMDTNNAIMIRNARELNAQYLAFIEELKRDGTIVDKMSDFVHPTIEQSFEGKSKQTLRAENEYMLKALAARWKQEGRFDSNRMTAVLDKVDEAGEIVADTTNRLMLFRGDFEKTTYYTEGNTGNAGKFQSDLSKAANTFDAIFKVF